MGRKINGFSKLLYPQIFAFGIFQTRSLKATQPTALFSSHVSTFWISMLSSCDGCYR